MPENIGSLWLNYPLCSYKVNTHNTDIYTSYYLIIKPIDFETHLFIHILKRISFAISHIVAGSHALNIQGVHMVSTHITSYPTIKPNLVIHVRVSYTAHIIDILMRKGTRNANLMLAPTNCFNVPY